MYEVLQLLKTDLKQNKSYNFQAVIPSKIINLTKQLELRYESKETIAPKDLKSLCIMTNKAYEQSNKDMLLTKFIRYLPIVLYYSLDSKMPIQSKDYTLFILEILVKGKKISSSMNLLIKQYLKYFGLPLIGADLVRQYINELLPTISSKRKSVQFWQNNIIMFENNAIERVLYKMRNADNMDVFFESIGITKDLRNVGFAKALTYAYFNSKSVTYENKYKNLSTLLEIPNMNPPKETVAVSASALIPEAEQYNTVDHLRQFYLKYLDDPRFPGSVYWNSVSEEARKIFKRWVSKFDIEAFFELIARSAQDKAWMYRKLFWEAYFPYIETTWIALGRDARNILKSVNNSGYAQERYSTYASLTQCSSQQSVFMFEIKGYLFIEWSHAGALKILSSHNPNIKIGEGIYYATEFRQISTPDYFKHSSPSTYCWQKNLESWLNDHCGILPIKSYRM